MTIAFNGSLIKTATPQQTQKPVVEQGTWKNFQNFELQHVNLPTDVVQTTCMKKAEAPQISTARAIFSRLTNEQIEAVNSSRELPKNVKVKDNGSNLYITYNLWDVTPGTHQLPKGYELKKDILGFTHVVREGTKAWFLKN